MMEKQKETVCSPDTVLEDYLRNLESETDSSKASTSDLGAPKDPKPSSRWAEFLQLFKTKSKRHLSTFHPLKLSKRFSSSLREEIILVPDPMLDTSLNYFKPQWKNFALSDLQTATKSFSQECLVGKGGYAEVYKGSLRDGQLVAIKRLTRGSMEERTGDFLSELGIMAHVNHPNTAKLIGYGVEGGFYLVLELSPHGSLASLLHSAKEKLKWNIRYKIALGTAKGLLYLHESCQRRIIHRDVKAANILLTQDFDPQICDFGLAKWLPRQWTHLTVSKFEGTFGYLAPEFLMHGIVDEKTDVFAFGVLLLELITGRRALDYSQQSLVLWAKPQLKKSRIRELVDPSLAEYDPIEMNLMVLAASLCVQESAIRRPRMSQVLLLLRGSCGSLELVRKGRKLSHWKRYYEELFHAED
ncbi:receptor-like cytosolic serine/threonine-protein kinase RBK2 isoform X1 [Coffea eugenioides]|uniref:non-specific serine/threonine protein kinase n=2 Tax=Coffea arabica TaxID=13443 RepID=A0A6P6V466_COFAR|nr:receptor-like cytosolic serine/threonine-protein kinase RBK2 isoform X1 [Coffea arabica]XP_027116200.1 receptor-like cytosolic serine/threonine-protein kinase RBK2 isoform X1 [Coffea arabica]XP_027185609.1 receptor-like cytosolic serine/threonine-protein kinase RBK2 isoform X1 [Coffea eugenioides]